MDDLEREASDLVDEFVTSQQFQSTKAMLLYFDSLKEMHAIDHCDVCVSNLGNKKLPQQQQQQQQQQIDDSNRSDDVVVTKPSVPSFSGVSSDKKYASMRKSRRSVCVPKLRYSSSESDLDESDDDNDGREGDLPDNDSHDNGDLDNSNHDNDLDDNSSDDEVFVKGGRQRTVEPKVDKQPTLSSRHIELIGEESAGESPIVSRKKKNFQRISSNSDSSDDETKGKQNIHSISTNSDSSDGHKVKKKNFLKISSNSESSNDEKRVKKKNFQKISSNSDSSSDDEKVKKKNKVKSRHVNNDSFIVDDDDLSDVGDSSEGDSSMSDMTQNIKKLTVRSSSSDSSSDEFEKDTKKSHTNKRPLTAKSTNIMTPVRSAKVMTPKSAIQKCLDTFPTPSAKAVPGTPAFKRHFNSKREGIVKELFLLYNRTVFDNRLPDDLSITWNKRMTKTAGFCYLSKSDGERKSRIELSDKVIDSVPRVRDTLIHELCHAATWIFEGERGHGREWKYWAKKANRIHPDLPVVTTCHSYDIQTKYNYQCDGCGQMFGRHTKSIDHTKTRCGNCGGRPLLVSDKGSTTSSSDTPKPLNAYASYVKENFSSVKKSNPSLSSKDLMKKIAEDYRASKHDKENSGSIS